MHKTRNVTFFHDKVICNFKKLVPKKPKPVTVAWYRSNCKQSPWAKGYIFGHFGSLDLPLTATAGNGEREGRRGKKEGKERSEKV